MAFRCIPLFCFLCPTCVRAQEFVCARFAPEKLSDAFVKSGGKPPAWLNKLITDPQGRALIYQLSASHRNCLLLNCAIQKILVQVGGGLGPSALRGHAAGFLSCLTVGQGGGGLQRARWQA